MREVYLIVIKNTLIFLIK